MNRRNFIKVVGVGGTSLVVSGFISNCGDTSKADAALEAWDIKKMSMRYTDPRLQILSYAILAPSAHNKQPWKIELGKGLEMRLFVDRERLLPMTDPLHRQIYLSQGTFLESLNLASSSLGYLATIQLFPDGIDDVSSTGTHPVALIRFDKASIENDPLFHQLAIRATNRLPYDASAVSEQERLALSACTDTKEFFLNFVHSELENKKLSNMMIEAMRIETFLDRTHEETVKMIRFNDEEVVAFRDGFGYANLGVKGISRFFAEKFAGRSKAMTASFREKTMEMTSTIAGSAGTFGILFSNGNERPDQVAAGRVFARIFLTATQLGLALQPMSQILQEYDELSAIRKQFNELVNSGKRAPQMLFRLGRANTVPHTARRRVDDLIKA